MRPVIYKIGKTKTQRWCILAVFEEGSKKLLRHNNELDPDGIGTGAVMTWKLYPGAIMYCNLLNKKVA